MREGQNPPGRPAVTPGQETVVLAVRMGRDDRERVHRMATAQGQSAAEFVRDLVHAAWEDNL